MTRREEEILREAFPSQEDFRLAEERFRSGEPLAYVIGEWFFWREKYKITHDVLVPRPETEHLVEKACEFIPRNGRFLELCTGSGCVPISILNERTDLTADAIELSPEAVSVAEENAKSYGLGKRLNIYHADALLAETGELLIKENGGILYDAVISNPPYIRSSVIPDLSETVKSEPHMALDGGDDGLLFYRAFLNIYPRLLKKNGIMLFEIGYDQADDLKRLCRDMSFFCEVYKDYSGNDRVVRIVV